MVISVFVFSIGFNNNGFYLNSGIWFVVLLKYSHYKQFVDTNWGGEGFAGFGGWLDFYWVQL